MDIHSDLYKRRKELAIHWYNKASDLRGAAGALWASMDTSRSSEIVDELGLGKGFSMRIATSPVYAMLCGMSLELLYKAIVVAKGYEPNIKSHRLSDLALDAGVTVTKQHIGLLEILSESVIWEGRYPVPKDLKHMQRLIELRNENLYDQIPLGKLHVLSPNGALSWESFNRLWSDAFEVYAQNHS